MISVILPVYNAEKHIEESSKTLDTVNEVPKEVVVFTKPPTTVIGYGDAIEHNQNITKHEKQVMLGNKENYHNKTIKHITFG